MTDGIVVEGLSKTYRRGLLGESVRALEDVSLAVAAGEIFGIIGPNGAGKTTLLGCLLGFLRPDRGRVTVAGRETDDLEVRSVTGYLPERLVLDRWMSGREFLAYHHALAGRPAATRAAEATAALADVELPPEADDRPLRQYSRGMLQRLGLAQALLGEPRFVFLDEPASGVDPAGVLLFRRLIAGLKGRGVTVVINSHQLDQVERVCDRVAFVSRGRVETIEVLSAGTALARAVRVRWTAGAAVDAAVLRSAAEASGAELLEAGPTTARFSVADDEGAARLLRGLVERGVPVVEAGPEEGRLERLFVAGARSRSAAGGAP